MSENVKVETATILTIKEFGIYNISKYIKSTVDIDKSTENVNDMSTGRNPIFNVEQLFLKVLVEGKSNLFLYENAHLKRFFYQVDNSSIEQLIYKRYKVRENKIGENNAYKQQLWKNLICQNISLKNIENLSYGRKNLTSLFIKYNECSDTKFTTFMPQKKENLFNFTIKAGLSNSTLAIQHNGSFERKVDFGDNLGPMFGVEAEFILPFNKNKWAIIIESSYSYFKSEEELT